MQQDKVDFLNFYSSGPHPKLTIHFDRALFLKDSEITLIQEKSPYSEVKNYYVLRAVKNGELDSRAIEDRENDSESQLITLATARKDPDRWDLSRYEIIPKKLWPIPIARDTLSGRTLILDSNHLLADPGFWPNEIPAVIISAPNLDRVFRDFRILNRQ